MALLSWLVLPFSSFASFFLTYKAGGCGWFMSFILACVTMAAAVGVVILGFQAFVNAWWPTVS
jgi:hypothetical protein